MNDLIDLTERATEDLRPDVEALVTGGMQRGRRLRTRRRVGTVALTGLCVATGAAVVLAVPALTGSSSPRPTSSAVQPAAPSPERTLPTREALAGGAVVALPTGSGILKDSWDDGDFVGAIWSFTPESGGGAGDVSVLVERMSDLAVTSQDFHVLQPGSDEPPPLTVERVEYTPEAACHQEPGTCRALPDGSWVSSRTAPEPKPGGGDSDIVAASASLFTVDGFKVSATAWNAPGEKHVAITRADHPAIGEAELVAMVRAARLG